MNNKLILVGGGGHCRSCIEVIEASQQFVIQGVLDGQLAKDSKVLEYPVLGGDELIASYSTNEQIHFLITVGQILSPRIRIHLSNQIRQLGGKLATVISPSAFVSKRSNISAGSIVMHQAIINSNCEIGEHAILNNKSLVEHDCKIGEFCHISTGAIVNGNCTIGDRVFVGSQAVLANGITITSDVIIGAGAVVSRSIAEPGVYAGHPARKVPKQNA